MEPWIEGVFWLDLLIGLFTTSIPQHAHLSNPKPKVSISELIAEYWKGDLFLNLVTLMPLKVVTESFLGENDANLFKLVKCLRIFTFLAHLNKLKF